MTRKPAASADSTKPQPCRPMVSSATAGPSVDQAPAWMRLRTPNPTTTIQSQGVAQKKLHPSRSSRRVSAGSPVGSLGGIVTGTRRRAASAQVRASTASAHPDPTVTTSNAPMVGPITIIPLRVSEISALAGWRSERGTSWGSALAIAGNPTPDTAPWTMLSRTSIQISACPDSTSTAIAPWLSAEATLENWSTSVRGNRSAITPP